MSEYSPFIFFPTLALSNPSRHKIKRKSTRLKAPRVVVQPDFLFFFFPRFLLPRFCSVEWRRGWGVNLIEFEENKWGPASIVGVMNETQHLYFPWLSCYGRIDELCRCARMVWTNISINLPSIFSLPFHSGSREDVFSRKTEFVESVLSQFVSGVCIRFWLCVCGVVGEWRTSQEELYSCFKAGCMHWGWR